MIRFDAYDRFLRACQRLFIGKVHFFDGFDWDEYFRDRRKALIVANHGPVIGPFAWVIALFPRIVDLGYGHFTYSAIAHPIIQNIPIFSRIVGYETRDGKRLRTADYVELLEQGQLNILSVAPEGEYTLYGNGVDIQPFRSPRSIEIALKAHCPIILMVGKGFEHWQRSVALDKAWKRRLVKRLALAIPLLDKLDEQALERAAQISVSAILGRIPDFYVASELYEPELTAEMLAGDRATRDEQLRVEAERMREQMIRMLERLRARTP